MCGMGLLHLAAEIIQHIGDNLLPQDAKSLRLVCSWLNLCVEPLVLSCVTLDIFDQTPATTIHQLETLASHKSRTSKFTFTLKIASLVPRRDSSLVAECVRFLRWEPSGNAAEACVRAHLAAAISSLENVGRVVWTMNEHDPDWARQTVSDAIASLRYLRNLQLIFPKSVYLSVEMNGLHLDRLYHLKNLSVFGACRRYHPLVSAVSEAIAHSPLSHLEIDSPWAHSPPLDEFLAKRSPQMRLNFSHIALADMRYYFRMEPCLRALRSLELINILPPHRPLESLTEWRTAMTHFYRRLTDECIFLSRIVIDDVFPAFLDYLSSYSGVLTEISILYLYKPVPWEELDELAARFYDSILPKHIGFLEVLNLSPFFTCKWCFHPKEHYSLFSRAKHLRSLGVSFAYNPSSVADQNLDYTLDDAVSSIMRLPQTLHFLTNIKINAARRKEWWRPSWSPRLLSRESTFAKELEDFTHAIRIGVNHFAFPSVGKEPSPHRPPMIEVEGRPPEWFREAGTRTVLRMDG